MFPELVEKLPEVKEILETEAEKIYEKIQDECSGKLERLDSQPSVDRMIELYESHGVSPEMMEEHGYSVPEDFYAQVASEDETVEKQDEKFDLEDIEKTELVYYEDEYQKQIEAKILAVRGDWIVLDRTVFYPEGGGQEPDKGKINGKNVVDVQKQENIVLHKVPDHEFETGDEIKGQINWSRRFQLMQHHSITRSQWSNKKRYSRQPYLAGRSPKTVEKARLDVTHYDNIDRDPLRSRKRLETIF